MSKAIDNLSRAVEQTVKTSAGVTFTKDKVIDLIDSDLSELYNVSQFFTALSDGDAPVKLQNWIASNRRNTALKSMAIYNQLAAGLASTARSAMDTRILGAISDTTSSLIVILEDISGNLGKLFGDKTITIYNTKISQVAVFGMISNAASFAKFSLAFIEQFMADRNPNLGKPEKYVNEILTTGVAPAVDLMNRVLNQKLSKSFTSAMLKYRNGGSDINVVNGENQPTVQFTKINSDVTEADVNAGAKGFKIFRIIGNWFVDHRDRKNRKNVALREQLQARARLLQLELENVDPNSPEYQRLLKIIANYQKQIDRLNQEIAKYEEES
jgi:hypothetical protein